MATYVWRSKWCARDRRRSTDAERTTVSWSPRGVWPHEEAERCCCERSQFGFLQDASHQARLGLAQVCAGAVDGAGQTRERIEVVLVLGAAGGILRWDLQSGGRLGDDGTDERWSADGSRCASI